MLFLNFKVSFSIFILRLFQFPMYFDEYLWGFIKIAAFMTSPTAICQSSVIFDITWCFFIVWLNVQ